MGKMPRKDYNGAADVAAHNEVLKRVNTQNAPYSVQATGHDLTPKRSADAAMTSENIDALVAGDRLLDANRIKHVKTATKNLGVLTTAVLIYKDYETGEEIEQSYTKDQLLKSKSLFIAPIEE